MMHEYDEHLIVSTRLSYGEPVSDVLSDMRESFLTGHISAKRFIKDCAQVVMLFHVPSEINRNGPEKCQKLAEDCLAELEKHQDLFARTDVQNVVLNPDRPDRVENFSNFSADTYACILVNHFMDPQNGTEAIKQNAVKFTLRFLLPHSEILSDTLAKLDKQSDEPDFHEFERIFRNAVSQLKKEIGPVFPRLPPQGTASPTGLLALAYNA